MNKIVMFFLKKYISSPKREWLRFDSVFMVLGIIISVATLTVALSIFEGYETVLKKTILGSVLTLEVMPVMTFKGLYDKKGDTVIWYTADECRVPVLINSKIVIGSLTAKLAAYENSACTRYETVQRKKK